MNQPPPEPPVGPGQPAPPYQQAPPPPAKSRRPLVIGLVSAAVAVVLCLGLGCAGLVTYYLRSGESDDASGPAGRPPAPSSAGSSPRNPTSCGAGTRPTQPETSVVGTPDFAAAPTSGTATMRIGTNLGPIVITIDRARTPCTAASFQHLANRKFFDQSRCHRLVTEGIFVLQCGDPTGTGQGGPDYQFADENLDGARYTRGVVAMANAGAGTNGSQFFIIYRDSDLPPNYTPFGTVTSGLDIVERVAAGGHDDSFGAAGGGVPKVAITIQTLTVD
ncbi:peptidylprolyl isomerase [Plantactinospora sp. CA-290183]|uniref:peptidylprolyl isomerase n=1 Tax=Plantactinospora sp. CA-290183 TaxID=3240006 RepID=UPI003D8C0A95